MDGWQADLTPQERAEALARAQARRRERMELAKVTARADPHDVRMVRKAVAEAHAQAAEAKAQRERRTPVLVRCSFCATMGAAELERCAHCGAPRT
jgi:hypothetical protein